MLDVSPPDKASQAKLSRREIAVLELIFLGQISSEIGKALFISSNTVDTHRRHIMQKLGLHSIAKLTQYAIRENLVRL